jgi:hypothetical protein
MKTTGGFANAPLVVFFFARRCSAGAGVARPTMAVARNVSDRRIGSDALD